MENNEKKVEEPSVEELTRFYTIEQAKQELTSNSIHGRMINARYLRVALKAYSKLVNAAGGWDLI